ncbi:unnamed protein product [Cylindrotheca closterium]|uniref:Photosystem II reaction center Psb28 protein n=1 Tax=Cylindrotheca closterium TaxID=2856 RepID=A0AAD2JJB9_9STRA|nr:unnamed protein product [Cylindrotheca closterium]
MKAISLIFTLFLTSVVQGFLLVVPQKKNAKHNPNRMRSSSSSPGAKTTGSSTTLLFQTPNAIQEQEDNYLQLAMQYERRPDVVYVIMYNPGTEQEGIHTMEFPRGSETDLLLAFESIEDCVGFSNSLRQDPNWQQEPVPTPTPLDQVEIACQGMGLPIKIVPDTSQLG